jgi:hypothetical protein
MKIHSRHSRGFGLVESLAVLAIAATALVWWIVFQTKASQKAALERLAAGTAQELQELGGALVSRLRDRAPLLAESAHEFVSIADLVQGHYLNAATDDHSPFATQWQACLWKDAEGRPYAAVYESAGGGAYARDLGVFVEAGADPRSTNARNLELVFGRVADEALRRYQLKAGMIPAQQTHAKRGVGDPSVPSPYDEAVPCIAAINEPRLVLLIQPSDINWGVSSSARGEIREFFPKEMAATWDTGFDRFEPLREVVGRPFEVSGNGATGSLTVDETLLEKLVGAGDNPDGHHGITVVLVGGGGAGGFSDRAWDAQNQSTWVRPGGGGGSGYVKTVTIPKEILKVGDVIEVSIGKGGVPGGNAGAPVNADGVGSTTGQPTCVRVLTNAPGFGVDGGQKFAYCAEGGQTGGAGQVYAAGTTLAGTSGNGGHGGSGGGAGWTVKAVCQNVGGTAYFSQCGFEERPGTGGAGGLAGQPGKYKNEAPIGLPGQGQGAGFLPMVDGIQFEAPARDERRTVRVCSTTRNCLDDEPVDVATQDGFAIGAKLKVYPVGWWDTGGYGICFTRTPGSRGQEPIDPGCLDPDRAPLAAVNRPNPLAIGRGYGAGGRSCWNKHQAARFGNHCDDLPKLSPLTDAPAALAELAHGAAGAVYLYWLEK